MPVKSVVAALGAALLGASAVAASAMDAPHVRNGLWETEVHEHGMNMAMTSCVSDESQKVNSVFSSQVRRNGQCSAPAPTRNLDGSWTAISTCAFIRGKPPVTSRMDVTGDFGSSYTMTLRSPPSAAPTMTMTARYRGACPPGQRGGDITINGRTMNMVDMVGKN